MTTRAAHRESLPLRDEDFADEALALSSWVRLDRPSLLSESIMLGRAASADFRMSDSRPAIPRAVWALGFVSLLMDVSSELIHSLLPVFIWQVASRC